jgi:hypothetical protein
MCVSDHAKLLKWAYIGGAPVWNELQRMPFLLVIYLALPRFLIVFRTRYASPECTVRYESTPTFTQTLFLFFRFFLILIFGPLYCLKLLQ